MSDREAMGEKPAGLTQDMLDRSGRGLIDQHVFDAAVRKTRMPMSLSDPNLPDAPLIYVNDAFAALTGYRPDEAVGRNCRFLQGPGTDPASVQRIRDAVAQRRPITEDLYNYRKDGSGFWNSLFVSPVFDDDGRLSYLFASQSDISYRREALRRQTQRLDSMSALVAGVAHEFNNLMTVVLGSLEQVAARSADAGISRYLERADQAAQRAGKFANELLSLAGRECQEISVLDISELLRASAPTLTRAIGPDVTIDLDLAPATLVRLDRERFERVLFNLIHNARDAMPGGGRITLQTRVLPGPAAALDGRDTVELVVADTGAGMSPPVKKRATELFFTTKAAGDSTGLGLFLTLEFVDEVGGRLSINSEVGQGTTVSLMFPHATAARPDASQDALGD